MWLTCWLSSEGDGTIVHARGEIDVFTSASLGRCLQTAMMGSRGQMILDLSEVTFIDGSGLRILERCQQECRDRGLSFNLTQPASHIRRLLELVDLDRVLSVIGSAPERDDDASAHGAGDPGKNSALRPIWTPGSVRGSRR